MFCRSSNIKSAIKKSVTCVLRRNKTMVVLAVGCQELEKDGVIVLVRGARRKAVSILGICVGRGKPVQQCEQSWHHFCGA